MRDIKFRAWDKITNTMCVIWDIGWKGWDSPDESINYVRIETDGTVDRMENEVVLMQYTGLKDKNGKEIYEGDILDEKSNSQFKVVWRDVDCGFCADFGDTLDYNLRDLARFFEVAGNIYENKDLLAGEIE
jgi:uncharacterized phage protein (TIGR01671 family)